MPRIETKTLQHLHETLLTKAGKYTIEHLLVEENTFTYALEKAGTKYLMILFRVGNPLVPSIDEIDRTFIKAMLERQHREKRTLLLRWTVAREDEESETLDYMTWHPLEFQGRYFLEAYRSKESYELFLAAAAAYNAREKDLWEPLLAQNAIFYDKKKITRGKEAVKSQLYDLGESVRSLYFGYRAIGHLQLQPMLFSPERKFGLLLSTKDDGSAIQEVRPISGLTDRHVIRERTIRTSHPLVPPISLYIAKSQVAASSDDDSLAMDITLAFLDQDLRKQFQQRRFVVASHYEEDGTSKSKGLIKRTWTNEMVDHAWIDDDGALRFPNGEVLSPFWVHANCPVIEENNNSSSSKRRLLI